MKLKYEFNSPEFDSFSKEKGICYVICSTPRSGSTLLSKGLLATLVAGLPHEYFNVDHKSDYYSRWQFQSLEEYIYLLKKNRITRNGVFGFKLHFSQFEDEFQNNCLDNYFSNLKYVFITRKDKVSQGISLEKALQTNKWSSEFNSLKKAKFRFSEIEKRINNVKNQELKWKSYFIKYNIKPFVVNYEDLDSNYEYTIRDVLNFLEVKEKYTVSPQQLHKQRTLINYLWKKLYQTINLLKHGKNNSTN